MLGKAFIRMCQIGILVKGKCNRLVTDGRGRYSEWLLSLIPGYGQTATLTNSQMFPGKIGAPSQEMPRRKAILGQLKDGGG